MADAAFKTRAHDALADPNLKTAIDRTTGTAETKRAVAVAAFPEFQAARARGAAIKDHVIANLDYYLIEFERNATASGAQIHWARDTAEAAQIVTKICTDAKCEDRHPRQIHAGRGDQDCSACAGGATGIGRSDEPRRTHHPAGA